MSGGRELKIFTPQDKNKEIAIMDGIEDFINSYEPSRCKFCGEPIQWGLVVDGNRWRPLQKDFMGFHRCVAATMGDEMTDANNLTGRWPERRTINENFSIG